MKQCVSKIKYIRVLTKIYEVIKISFFKMAVTAISTDFSVAGVPECEVFDITDFKDFKVTLINGSGQADIIDLAAWKNRANS